MKNEKKQKDDFRKELDAYQAQEFRCGWTENRAVQRRSGRPIRSRRMSPI